ncbi:tetratricopeptide repeat protein [Pseudomarimonas arenosa]|uniref:Tetratricopeptide repeat protein n=1 Tax=Pseudomarimonas arenosa TaxID=2774145 RepID=A0AAW3ZJR8_9GAMM|nr:tetratricopeptide repeat protein [Pseudomarimonas arenosa]MBD8526353.1 tetratricopeptide repeat protein [Pseudomarimonas arenosa]
MTPTRLLHAVVALLLLVVFAVPADAARSKKDEKPEPAYPNAVRKDPEHSVSRRLAKQVQKTYDLAQGEDFEKTYEAAVAVRDSKFAGPYEKSLAWQIIGISWIDRDDYPKAIEAFEQTIENDGLGNDQHYQTMFQISQLYMSEEDYDNALKWLNRFFDETQGAKPEQLAVKANILYRQEKPAEAIDVMKRAITESDDPQTSWYQILLACYAETEQYDEAGKLAEQLLEKNPNDKPLMRNLAAIYMNADMNDKAIAVLERAKANGMLTEERDYKQLYQLYHYAEKEAEAIATINEGLAKGILPETVETYRFLGEANYFGENLPGAIEAYRKAAALATDGEMHINLARVLYEESRWAEAKQAANDALSRGVRRRGDAYILLGGAELESGNRAAAIAAYKEAAKYPETENNAKSWLRSVGVK